ncbi:MAG: type II secretion system F family protein [Cypionkella sp.]|nr:type II secretion system F family protein [Cypionkella sp.]
MALFDTFYAMIEAQFGALTPLMLLGGAGLIVVMLVLPILLVKPQDAFDKVKSQRIGREVREVRPQMGETLRREEKADKLQKFASFLEPQNSGQMDEARMQMMRAGYRGKNAVRMFHFLQLVLGLGGLALGAVYALIASLGGELSLQFMAISIVLPAGIGYYLPKYMVTRRIQSRQTEITEGFPDALDLMLVCVEAGQSLDQSINRIAKESRASYPALSDELEIVSQEVKAGKERVTVLKDMAQRVDVPDITAFVTTLVQSATFGTSIAEALRMYSAEMRDKRVMRAEERANKLPTKMTLGTMMFTLPPLMIILVGPSIFGLMQNV